MTSSSQLFNHFGTPFSINNDAETLNKVISNIRIRRKFICECCERNGHTADDLNIRGPKFLPTSLRIKINHFNKLNGDGPTVPQIECINQPPPVHLR